MVSSVRKKRIKVAAGDPLSGFRFRVEFLSDCLPKQLSAVPAMESLKSGDTEVASAAAAKAAKTEAARKNLDFIAKNLLAGGECLFSIQT